MEQENKSLQIPFVKPARVGNFKLWRSKSTFGSGKDKVNIEVINISNLDGSWKVQIPQTSQMFGFISQQFATVDENIKDNMLGMVFTNMLNITLTPSPALHDSLFFLTEMMTYPYMLLSEKEMTERMEKGLKEFGWDKVKRKEHIGKMVEYRKQLYDLIEKKKSAYIEDYERQQAERRAKEEESLKSLEQDEIAEQAMEVLNENEKSDEDTD